MGEPCCHLPCCAGGSGPVAVMATRQEIMQLRQRAQREGWLCQRCGLLVSSHWMGFECVDPLTRQIRAIKLSG